MKKKLLSILLVSTSLSIYQGYAQIQPSIIYNSEGRFLNSFRGQELNEEKFNANLNAYFGLNMDHSFVVKARQTSKVTGLETIKYQQYYKGFLVQNAEVLVRVQAGKILSVNGRILPQSNKIIDLKNNFTEKEIENIVKQSEIGRAHV